MLTCLSARCSLTNLGDRRFFVGTRNPPGTQSSGRLAASGRRSTWLWEFSRPLAGSWVLSLEYVLCNVRGSYSKSCRGQGWWFASRWWPDFVYSFGSTYSWVTHSVYGAAVAAKETLRGGKDPSRRPHGGGLQLATCVLLTKPSSRFVLFRALLCIHRMMMAPSHGDGVTAGGRPFAAEFPRHPHAHSSKRPCSAAP